MTDDPVEPARRVGLGTLVLTACAVVAVGLVGMAVVSAWDLRRASPGLEPLDGAHEVHPPVTRIDRG